MPRFKGLGKCTIKISLMVPRYPTFGMTCETKTWNTCGYNSFHFVVLYSISYSKTSQNLCAWLSIMTDRYWGNHDTMNSLRWSYDPISEC